MNTMIPSSCLGDNILRLTTDAICLRTHCAHTNAHMRERVKLNHEKMPLNEQKSTE